MSVHPHEGDLHRHYDGELPARESWEIEAHLRECSGCAAVYNDIREMTEAVGELPDSIEPPVDLWPSIAGRLGEPGDELEKGRSKQTRQLRVRRVVMVGWLAAVAAALVLGVGLGRIFPGTMPQLATELDPVEVNPGITPAAVLASYEEPAYDTAVAELEAILAGMRDQLEPETVAVVEENLAIIDQAIAEAQAALLADPANAQLHSHLSNTRQMKLRMLRMVTAAAT